MTLRTLRDLFERRDKEGEESSSSKVRRDGNENKSETLVQSHSVIKLLHEGS